jgi:hypothetical protein
LPIFTYPPFARPPADGLCAVPGCRATAESGPRIAVPGSETCGVHRRQFRGSLMALARGWEPLEQSIAGGGVVGTSWNPRASQLRTEISDWTGFLVRTIRGSYDLPAPEIRRWPRTETLVQPDGSKVVRRYEVIQHLAYEHWVSERRHTADALTAIAANYASWLAGFPGLGAALVDDAAEFTRRYDTAVKASPVRRRLIPGAICGQLLDAELGMRCAAPMHVTLDTVDDPDFEDAAWRKQGLMQCSDRPEEHRTYKVEEWAAWLRS